MELFQVYLFAGTSEGRVLAQELAKKKIRCRVFVVSDYGGKLLPESGTVCVSVGRLDKKEMEAAMQLLSEDGIVFDATHPYADVVTENIREAAKNTGRRYYRILRKSLLSSYAAGLMEPEEGELQVDFVKDAAEAAEFLKSTRGNVLLTTGSKELSAFTEIENYQKRLYARVLPTSNVVAKCEALGFDAGHLICMQGPFTKELNAAMLRQIGAAWMVTKESGQAGGFPEKYAAARDAGCRLLVIGRPMREVGVTLEEALSLLPSN